VIGCLVANYAVILHADLSTATVQDEEKGRVGSSYRDYGDSVFERIQRPDPREVTGMSHGNYDKLDDDGLVPPGAPPHVDHAFVSAVTCH
jgi:hypothetical protein